MKNITNVPLSVLRHAFQNMSKSAFTSSASLEIGRTDISTPEFSA